MAGGYVWRASAVVLMATLAIAGVALAASTATLVRDINPGSGNSNPNGFTAVAGKAYFRACGPIRGCELWKSDGTAAGTKLVKDINPGSASSHGSSARFVTNLGGKLLLSATDETHGNELWRSDGTAAGTKLVKDIYPGSESSYPRASTPSNDPENVGGTLFFVADDGFYGSELWRSDGTAAGTKLVKDIYPGNINPEDSFPMFLTNVAGTLYFRACNPTRGCELWRSDGTAAGTRLVKDINPGAGSSKPFHLASVAGTLYFGADDGTHGHELWRSDGTAAGTKLVKDISAGGAGSFPLYLMNAAGTLFFAAETPAHGRELWRSDGTAAGTKLVKDIYPGSEFGNPGHSYTNVRGELFFPARDRRHGYELWRSDGTAAGTRLVKDINPGSFNSSPSSPTDVAGTLFFSAYDPTHARELWRSDGTPARTRLVRDIHPGNPDYPGNSDWDDSELGDLTNVAGTLFFAANDGKHGRELWKAVP
jgi:trimeric autotransporter adhesin